MSGRSKGSWGGPGSPGFVEFGGVYAQAQVGHTFSGCQSGTVRDPWAGGGSQDPWAAYLGNTHAQQQQQAQPGNFATAQASSAGSVSGGRSGSNFGQVNSGFWPQGFVTRPGVPTQGVPTLHDYRRTMPPVAPPGLAGCGKGNGVHTTDRFVAARSLLQSLNQLEIQSLLQEVAQRFSTDVRTFVPETLGQAAPGPNVPGFVRPDVGLVLPGSLGNDTSSKEEKDAFTRSEKWLGSPPTPKCETWKTREDEILGMSLYLEELVSWINQGSVDYGREVAQAARWPTQVNWTSLTRSQQTRGVRLFSLLKVAFADMDESR